MIFMTGDMPRTWSHPFRSEAPFGAQGLSLTSCDILTIVPAIPLCIVPSESGQFFFTPPGLLKGSSGEKHALVLPLHFSAITTKSTALSHYCHHEVNMCTVNTENTIGISIFHTTKQKANVLLCHEDREISTASLTLIKEESSGPGTMLGMSLTSFPLNFQTNLTI